MSQKPRTGAPIRPVNPTRVPVNEVVAAPVPMAPAPEVAVDSALYGAPGRWTEPVAEPAVSAPVAADIAPTSETIPELVTAIADTIPATTAKAVEIATAKAVEIASAEAVEISTAIQPKIPTPTLNPTPTLSQGMKTMMKSTEDLVAFGQANLEAFVKSGQIWSAGVQELTKQFATTAKASFEESVSTFKAMSTAKSVKEAMEMQSTFAKAALEKAMAESNKLTDASIKLTEQTLAPITARVTVAVETFGKAAEQASA
jgi:phasin family protein